MMIDDDDYNDNNNHHHRHLALGLCLLRLRSGLPFWVKYPVIWNLKHCDDSADFMFVLDVTTVLLGW